jgi:UPF0271 protein
VVAVDLNADLGEGYGVWSAGDDDAMLDIVTSANVACGFHAGDPSTLRRVCAAAVQRSVRIGAQVSFPDLAGFGRRHMEIPSNELTDIVLYQLGALDAFAQVAGAEVSYVKPHGALYHAAAIDPRVANAIVTAVIEYDPSMAVLGLPHSHLLDAAQEHGLEPIAEGFADRAYHHDGQLVARSHAEAVLHAPIEVATRAVQMVCEGTVQSVEGAMVNVPIRSLCIHGDTPGAVAIAGAVKTALTTADVVIFPFT